MSSPPTAAAVATAQANDHGSGSAAAVCSLGRCSGLALGADAAGRTLGHRSESMVAAARLIVRGMEATTAYITKNLTLAWDMLEDVAEDMQATSS